MIKFDNFYCLMEGGNLSIDNKYFADEIKLQYFVMGFRLAASLVFGVAGLQQQNQNLPALE